AFGKPQPHHQHLFDGSVAVDRRDLLNPGSRSLHGSEPLLRGPMLPGREFASISGEPTVRPGADTDVILVAPIGEVMATLSAGTPSDSRFTPAAAKARKRAPSAELGLASRVTSTSGVIVQRVPTRSSSAATVSAGINDGVPPPKKTEPIARSGTSSA